MRNRQAFRVLGIGVIALSIAVIAAFGLRALGARSADSASGDQPVTATIRATQIDGQTHLLVPQGSLTAGDIAVEPLKSIEFQQRVEALATIVSPQALLEQRRAYQTAAAEAARGELATRAARLEVQRLQRLHRDDRIVSDKTLETAQVQAATEDTSAQLASSQLRLQGAAQRQQWGPVIAGWLVSGSPQLDRVLSGRDLLLQLALPADGRLLGAAKAQLELPSGGSVDAAIISGVPQADPRFQAPGFYATVASDPRLLPGMTVSASVLAGAPMTGIEVPSDAVVRWQGKPCAYIETSSGEFTRRPIPTGIATANGWLVPSGLPAGTRTVVRGTQLLLSEEMKVQSPADEGR